MSSSRTTTIGAATAKLDEVLNAARVAGTGWGAAAAAAATAFAFAAEVDCAAKAAAIRADAAGLLPPTAVAAAALPADPVAADEEDPGAPASGVTTTTPLGVTPAAQGPVPVRSHAGGCGAICAR